MQKVLLILLMALNIFSNELIREKFKKSTSGKKAGKPVIRKFSEYQTIIGTCLQGSSLGIYKDNITQENELFYECNNAQGTFEEIFSLPGLNNDSLLDFGFILTREETKQLYIIFSISEQLYHYEMVMELQNGSELAGPDNIPPLELKYLKFYVLKDINGDGTPEFINNLFEKNNEHTDWPDISDTLNLKEVYLKSIK